MENVFIYFIKASGLIGLFYLAYILLLRKETFFTANRWFLLSGLITAAILPLIVFTKIVWVEPNTTAFNWSNIPITTVQNAKEVEINWYSIVGYVYILVIVLLLLKLLFDFYSLSKVFKGKGIKQQENFKLIDVTENIAPFSFFKSIVYNSSLYTKTELENILEHEKVHSRQNHSIDVLLSRLFCIAFWFNPLIWLYKKAIVQNLEFIADNEASKNILDKKAYQLTLLKITTQENCITISNHFYQSLIKKRIIMLNKNQSNKRNSWKYITIFPALVAFVFLFQIEVVAQEKETPKQENEKKSLKDQSTEILVTKNTTDEELKKYCEELKKTHDIDLTFFNIKRNSKDEIINIESKFKSTFGSGTNFQSRTPIKPFKFFYENSSVGYLNLDFSSLSKDENIYINGEKSSQEELAKLDPKEIEKIDVATISGKKTILVTTKHLLKPVKITNKIIYIDGIKSTNEEFSKLDKNSIDKIDINTLENTIRITTKTTNNTLAQLDNKTTIRSVLQQDLNSKTLIIVDGEIQASNFRVEEFPTDRIAKIDVLKGMNARSKYGDSGKNGAIEITTKEKNEKKEFKSSDGVKVIGFKMMQDQEVYGWKAKETDSLDIKQIITNTDVNKTLIIIDGKKTKKTIKDIDKKNIDRISVLKGKNSVAKYGNDGKNGVIEIETKQSKK
jgi:hypothetical protein